MPDQPSAQWEPKNVLKRLRKATASGQSASAQVFVNDAVAADELQDKAKQIVDDAAAAAGLDAGAVRLKQGAPAGEIVLGDRELARGVRGDHEAGRGQDDPRIGAERYLSKAGEAEGRSLKSRVRPRPESLPLRKR